MTLVIEIVNEKKQQKVRHGEILLCYRPDR